MHAKSLQLCLFVCDPIDCSPPGSFVHGILQARKLEWVAMPSSWGSSQPRDHTRISMSLVLTDRFFTTSTTWEAPSKAYIGVQTLYYSCKFPDEFEIISQLKAAHTYIIKTDSLRIRAEWEKDTEINRVAEWSLAMRQKKDEKRVSLILTKPSPWGLADPWGWAAGVKAESKEHSATLWPCRKEAAGIKWPLWKPIGSLAI